MNKHLDSARAKLQDPTLGALTLEEMQALYAATQTPKRTHGPLTAKVIDQVLRIVTSTEDTAEAYNKLVALFEKYHMSPSIEQTWGDDAFQGVKTGS